MESRKLVIKTESIFNNSVKGNMIIDYVILNALGCISKLKDIKSINRPVDICIAVSLMELEKFFKVCGKYLQSFCLIHDYDIKIEYDTVSCKMDNNMYFTVTTTGRNFAFTAALNGEIYDIENAVKFAMSQTVDYAEEINLNYIVYLYYAWESSCVCFDKVYCELSIDELNRCFMQERVLLDIGIKYSQSINSNNPVSRFLNDDLPTYSNVINGFFNAVYPYYKNEKYVNESGIYLHSTNQDINGYTADTVYTEYPILDDIKVRETRLGYYQFHDMQYMREVEPNEYRPTLCKALIDRIAFEKGHCNEAWIIWMIKAYVEYNNDIILELKQVAAYYGVRWSEIEYWINEAINTEGV